MTKKFPIHNLLLGVTGSVGVLAVPEHIRLLRESMVENVYVMMLKLAIMFHVLTSNSIPPLLANCNSLRKAK